VDSAALDTGTVNFWSIVVTPRTPFCQTANIPPPARTAPALPGAPSPAPPGRSGAIPSSGGVPPAPAPTPRP
jgi:hypothetical protein